MKDSKNIPFVEVPILKRKRKAPKYSVLNFVEGYSSTSPAHHPASPRDQYREQRYQAIDVLMSSVNDPFDQPSFTVFEKLKSLLIKALTGEESSTEMDFVRETYRTDINIDDLVMELKILKTLFGNKKIKHFCDLTKGMKSMNEPEKKLVVNVCKIYTILAVYPASSPTAEHTFSMARRVKNWMRS